MLSVRKSPWNGRIDRSILASGNGQDVPNGEALPTKSKLPLELPWITVPAGYVVPKSVTANGRVIGDGQSSQWLPISVVPGTMTAPVEVVVRYGGQAGQTMLTGHPPAGGVKSRKIWSLFPGSIIQVGPLAPQVVQGVPKP